MEAFQEFDLEPVEFVEAGNKVAVVLRQRIRGKGSGMELVGETAHVWEFSGGRAVRMQVYADRARAVEAIKPET
jgi:ketosteroid isomerase-like protein